MNPKEAYDRLCDFLGTKVGVKICREYDKYYCFFIAPYGTAKDEVAFVGRTHYIVSKKTGKVYASDDYDSPRLPFGYWESIDTDIFR